MDRCCRSRQTLELEVRTSELGVRKSEFGNRKTERGKRKTENGVRKPENGKRSAENGKRSSVSRWASVQLLNPARACAAHTRRGVTTNCNIRAGLVITPHIQTTTCNRLLVSHLFPHNYNVSNMLHDALNCQKKLPLSSSFHASIMQHVHLKLHYRHHPTQAFTGLPPCGSLLPTPIGSTHHLCMKLIHVLTEHTLPYYKIIFKM